MKQFLIKTLLSFLIPVTIGALALLVLSFYTSKAVDYKLNANITTLYLGDSHIQLAVNDSLLKNSKNVSTSSEPYIFSYYKLEKLLEANPTITQVYLGVSYHNLSSYYDGFINGERSSAISPKYLHTLPFNEKLKLAYWNIEKAPNFLRGLFLISYKYLFKNEPYAGGYLNIFPHTTAADTSMDKRLKLQFYEEDKPADFSTINQEYLTKIITLCETNNITLYLLNAPLHPYYRTRIPAKFIEKYNQVTNSTAIETLNFSGLQLSDSSYIPDGDHLSSKGAATFSSKYLAVKK